MRPVLWIQLTLIFLLLINHGGTKNLNIIVSKYCNTINYQLADRVLLKNIQLKNDEDYCVFFEKSNSTKPFRFKVSSQEASEEHPVLVVVKQEKHIMSWEVPVVFDTFNKTKEYYYKSSRTVCHNNMIQINQLSLSLLKNCSQSFIVYLSTSSPNPITADLEVLEETQFYVTENVNYSLRISPAETRYVYYKFQDNSTDTLIVEINSEDDSCITVSIQDSNRKDYLQGFFLVYVAHPDNYQCSQEHSIPSALSTRLSNYDSNDTFTTVNFVIRKNINKEEYYNASYATLGIIGIFWVISGLMIFVSHRWGTLKNVKATGDKLSFGAAIMSLGTSVPDATRVLKTQEEKIPMLDTTGVNVEGNSDLISDRENLKDAAQTGVNFILTTNELFVPHLAKNQIKNKKQSFNYLWHILSIAIFYSIPVVQLVISHQRVVNQTGNQDRCYYNFMCAHPAFGFSDFNHIFSNIGYILIGILFLIVTRYRQRKVPFRPKVGIPVHYGLFYSMGIAMIIEGLLSASYHVCPNNQNFQFDTSFMYVMAVLCMVKLYQNRHSDINATSYATFAILGLAIFIAMVGILTESLVVWIIFDLCYSAMCVYISFQIYFLGYTLDGLKKMKNEIQENGFNAATFKPVKKSRFILIVMANVINLTGLLCGIILYAKHLTDFGTFLLILLMGNAVLYVTCYTIMKLIHKERICNEAGFYLILAVACWIAAAYFFTDPATRSTVTPSESRLSNQHCILFNFYDKHDIWHLLSAPALYLTFMFLMCLDDDLINKKQNVINENVVNKEEKNMRVF